MWEKNFHGGGNYFLENLVSGGGGGGGFTFAREIPVYTHFVDIDLLHQCHYASSKCYFQ